jgi:hypothetical protein
MNRSLVGTSKTRKSKVLTQTYQCLWEGKARHERVQINELWQTYVSNCHPAYFCPLCAPVSLFDPERALVGRLIPCRSPRRPFSGSAICLLFSDPILCHLPHFFQFDIPYNLTILLLLVGIRFQVWVAHIPTLPLLQDLQILWECITEWENA